MPALIVATLQATIVLAIGIWAYQNPVCRLAAAVLFHHGDLRSIAGGLWLIDFVAVRHPAAGVYRRVRLYDAGYSPVGYVSPVENMPQWLQDLTWINPIRHFTDITKQIYLKDASLEIVWEVCGRYWS